MRPAIRPRHFRQAAAAGLPAVATDCPASSLHTGVVTVPADFTATGLAAAMRRAMDAPPPSRPFRESQFLAAMDRILERTAVVVFTGVFGGYDELQRPRQRQPGVQYVCFTDNPHLKSHDWEVVYRPPSGDPLMQAKRIKVLGDEAVQS